MYIGLGFSIFLFLDSFFVSQVMKISPSLNFKDILDKDFAIKSGFHVRKVLVESNKDSKTGT
jgi:hypothetical protein